MVVRGQVGVERVQAHVALRGRHRHTVTAGLLGVVEGGVGGRQQVGELVLLALGDGGDANRDRDLDDRGAGAVVDGDGKALDVATEAGRDLARVGFGCLGEQQHELFAAEAAYPIVVARLRGKGLGDRLAALGRLARGALQVSLTSLKWSMSTSARAVKSAIRPTSEISFSASFSHVETFSRLVLASVRDCATRMGKTRNRRTSRLVVMAIFTDARRNATASVISASSQARRKSSCSSSRFQSRSRSRTVGSDSFTAPRMEEMMPSAADHPADCHADYPGQQAGRKQHGAAYERGRGSE